jgi:anti-anti-sigma factor
MTSSRTPDGQADRYPVCEHDGPAADGPCPHCGTLRLRFSEDRAAELFARIESAVTTGPVRVELDCRDVEFLPSVTLGQLITAQRKAQKVGGKIVFTHLRPDIREVFQITKLDRLFDVE